MCYVLRFDKTGMSEFLITYFFSIKYYVKLMSQTFIVSFLSASFAQKFLMGTNKNIYKPYTNVANENIGIAVL